MGLLDDTWGSYRGSRGRALSCLLLRETPVLQHRAEVLLLLLLCATALTGTRFARLPASDFADLRLLKVQSMLILLFQKFKLTYYIQNATLM